MADKSEPQVDEVSFYDYFVPFTPKKATVFIALIGFIVFCNMLFNGFVWDDRTFIQLNPDMQHLDIMYLFGPNMFNNISAGQYRAFTALYFTLLHTFFGNITFFYHIFQLLIHIVNTILIFYLFKRFFKIELSFFLSLLFLIHPIQVESVSYIASSDNPIFTSFGLTALTLGTIPKPTVKRNLLVFGLLFLSLLSKETGILFLFLIILYRFLFLKKAKKSYVFYGFITLMIYFFLRFIVAGVYFSQVRLSPITRLPFFARLLNVPAVIFYYLKTFLLPVHLVIIQYWTVTQANFQQFYLPLFFDLLFCFLLIIFGKYLRKKKKADFALFIFFCTWLIIGFGIYSQFFALDMTVADRWFYFPMIGLLGIIGTILKTYESTFFKQKKFLLTIGILILCIFSLRTIVRNTNWQDPITLYTHDSTIMDNFELENSLGGELNNAGQSEEAAKHFQKSVEMFPHETNLFNLGLYYEQKKDLKDAEKYYADAFIVQSYDIVPYPHQRLEIIYIRYAIVTLPYNPQKALTIINAGINDYPTDPTAWYLKAECEYKLHNRNAALDAAAKTVQLLPNNTTAINLYNNILKNKSINTTDQ